MTTPDTEWEKEFDSFFQVRMEDERHGSWCPPSLFTMKSFIRSLLSSRDTYWKQEVEKAFKQGQEDGAVNRGERRRIIEQIREERDTYWKEREKARDEALLAELWERFQGHYWDSCENVKPLVLDHVKSVLSLISSKRMK